MKRQHKIMKLLQKHSIIFIQNKYFTTWNQVINNMENGTYELFTFYIRNKGIFININDDEMHIFRDCERNNGKQVVYKVRMGENTYIHQKIYNDTKSEMRKIKNECKQEMKEDILYFKKILGKT